MRELQVLVAKDYDTHQIIDTYITSDCCVLRDLIENAEKRNAESDDSVFGLPELIELEIKTYQQTNPNFVAYSAVYEVTDY